MDETSRITRLEANYENILTTLRELKASQAAITHKLDKINPDVIGLKIEDAGRNLMSLRDDHVICKRSCDDRLKALENWKSNLTGRITVIASAISLVAMQLLSWIRDKF